MCFLRFGAAAMVLAGFSHAAFADETAAFSGAYVGLTAGYASIQTRAPQVAGEGYSCWSGDCSVIYSASSDNVAGGATAGYNLRMDSMVLGFESDFAASGGSGNSGLGNETFTTGLEYIGTFRARTGLLLDNTLVYVTGGVAMAKLDQTWSDSGYPLTVYDPDDWQTGWTAGAGMEYASTASWSVKVEGLYYDLGSTTELVEDNGALYGIQPSNSGFMARLGLNFDLN